jgi:hypothetical protein
MAQKNLTVISEMKYECNGGQTNRYKFKLCVYFTFKKSASVGFQVLVPLLWSSGQIFRLQIQRFRVRFPVLPDSLGIRSGTESTQPREDNLGIT